MTFIKELIDLYDNLNGKITDRKQKDLFMPLREKIAAVQQEMTDLDRKHWEEVREVHALNIDLREENLKLRAEVSQLEAKIQELTNQNPELPLMNFNSNGKYYTDPFDVTGGQYCPHCYEQKKAKSRLYHSEQAAVSGGIPLIRFKCLVCDYTTSEKK